MRGVKGVLVAATCLYVAGAFQPLAPRFAIFGVRPDFLLAALAPLCLLSSRRGGTLLGFAAGVIAGALPGANMAHYVISRTFGGFFASWSRELGLEEGIGVAAVMTLALSLVSQLVLMFLAPPARIGPFLGATIGSAVLNGLLAIPLYALLVRILDPVER